LALAVDNEEIPCPFQKQKKKYPARALLIATALHAEQGIFAVTTTWSAPRSVQSFTAKRKVVAAAAKIFPQFFSVKKSFRCTNHHLLDAVLLARASCGVRLLELLLDRSSARSNNAWKSVRGHQVDRQ